ncbi:hypothetical protein Z043_118232 [Scleropages formosus]|uniref:CLOCK-interacting pacemaker-like n=1 Tax=Scleropages formosus TaxID=113540 RepID=A0A0P7U7I1_SCLFO|nr:hypothetical protein Z043_118232 [Scleropages formosus]
MGSGYLSAVDHTDSEDASRTGARSTQSGPRVAVVAGSYPNLSPMIIMNNVVLKQVVFLQPVVSSGSGKSMKTAGSKQRSRKYLPILKSYPKIAPYPGESITEKSSSGSPEQSSSASSRSGRHHHRRRHHHRDRQQVSLMSSTRSVHPVNPQPASPKHTRPKTNAVEVQALDKSFQAAQSQELTLPSGAPASPIPEARVSSPCRLPVTPPVGKGLEDIPSDGQSKRKRFCNTYNILHRSGLLGITLRTKELIRLNRHTQNQLDHLQQQTSLFVEAVHSGDPQVWAKLQLAMLEAGTAGAVDEQENVDNDKEEAQNNQF